MLQLNATMLDLTAPPRSSLFERLTADLPPTVKLLARRITACESGLAVLGYLRCYSHTALTAPDLAAQIDQPLAAIVPALADWVAAGLIKEETAAGMRFYRLSSDPQRLRELDAVFAWREHWLSQALNIAQAVGAPLMTPRAPASTLRPATIQGWYLDLPPVCCGQAQADNLARADWP